MMVNTHTPSRLRPWLLVVLVIALLASACQPAASPVAQAPTAAPDAATATSTPVPPTPEPTATLTPAESPTPTLTPEPTATKAPKTIHETDNYLVLGMDQRPGEGAWRTDTIIVVAVDYDAGQVGLVSIPRDLWVNIPGYGMGRINQVDYEGESLKYAGGGPALLAKVIQTELGIPIPAKHWVRLRLEALPELVDALGGVTVTLDCPLHELTPDPKAPDSGAYLHFDLPAGEVFMDGETAAKFARYRYASSDFSRAKRQQQLIWAIRERALQVDAIPKIPELWKTLSKTFKTELSLVDVIRLARLGSSLQASQVHGLVFSPKAIASAVVGGGAQVVMVVDQAQVQKELDGLFRAQSISAQGREGSGGCATPQPPTATPTASTEAPMEVTVTP